MAKRTKPSGIESQYTAIPNQPQQYPLAWTTSFASRNATAVASNVITFTGTAIDATYTNNTTRIHQI